MEEVIRVREVRKSMEQSVHFFTPACSPLVNDPDVGGSSRPASKLRFPTSTPADRDLYMTLDLSSAVEEVDEEEDSSKEEPEPVRKKSSGGAKAAKAAPLGRRGLRDRPKPVVLDSTVSSLDSSTASELIPTPNDAQRRVIHKRNLLIVVDANCSSSNDFSFCREIQSGGDDLSFHPDVAGGLGLAVPLGSFRALFPTFELAVADYPKECQPG